MKEIKIYDDEKNGSCSSCSAGRKKKSSRKTSWRFVLIIFALALIFALLGLVDLKSNAAELKDYGYTYHVEEFGIIYESYNDDGTLNRIDDRYNNYNGVVYVSNMPFKSYLWYSSPNEYGYGGYGVAFVCESNQLGFINQDNGSYSSMSVKSFNYNGQTMYYFYARDTGYRNRNVKMYARNEDLQQLLATDYATENDFISAYQNDTLDFFIDYDSLEVDSSLPLIENVLANKISNKTGVNSGGHSVSAVKEYYDYITWKNTGNYDIQVERYPIVKLYEGTFSPKFLEDFEGDFYLMEILSAGNSSFTYQVDLPYIELNYPNDYSFLGKITTDVAGFWDTCELYYGYRLRYVDGANNKASCWTYVIPEQSNIKWDYIEYPYYSYVEYVDGSLSDNSDATGSSGEYDSLDDIDNAKNELDNENAFKDKYDILVGDVGTQEATNWLYSVVNFVKSTPNVVGSVLGFLPTPIRSGVFVVIFLGVISSGLAIIRALI